MILIAAQFQDGFVQYTITYNTDNGFFSIDEPGVGFSAYTKGIPGTLYTSHCVGLDQYNFYAVDASPYCDLTIVANSPFCGYNPTTPGSPLVIVSINTTNETGFNKKDGTATVNVTGGTPPYFLSIDGGATFNPIQSLTNLAPGTYNVVVQDSNGLQTTSSFVIMGVGAVYGCTDPTALNFDINATVDNGTCIYPDPDLPDNRLNIYETEDQFRLINRAGQIFLIEMPKGWDKIVFRLKRDEQYHGVNYEFSDGEIQLDFDEAAGRQLLLDEYNLNGNDGYMAFQFGAILSDGTFDPDIDAFIDFNNKDVDRDYFSVAVKTKRFNDAIETKNEVDVTLKDGYFALPLHGKIIKKVTNVNLNFKSSGLQSVGTSEFGSNPNYPAPGDAPFFTYWTFLDFSQPDQSDPSASSYVNDLMPTPPTFGLSQSNPQPTGLYQFIADGSGAFTFNLDFSLRIDFKLQAPPILDSRFGYWSYKWYLVINSVPSFELPGSVDGFTNSRFLTVDYVTNYVKTINLNQGDRVYLYGQFVHEKINNPPGLEGTININYMNVNITGESIAAPTTTQSKLAFEVIQDIISDISGNTAKLVSNLLGRTDIGYVENGCAALIAYTNGYLMRGFPLADRPIIARLKEIIEGLDANYAIGMGYELNALNEWVWRLEQWEYFYRDALIQTFSNVSDYNEPIDNKIIYNQLSFGYAKYTQDLEQVSTLDEFLTKHDYSTPIESYKQTLSRICKQIAAGYSIELTRRKPYQSNKDVSWTYDEDIFIISTVPDQQYGYRPEKLENFTASGVIGVETSYNIRLTVSRMLARWAKWINSGLAFKTNSAIIDNTFTAKNGDLTSQYIGTQPCESTVQFTEANDVLKGDLANGEQKFFPDHIEFKTKITWTNLRAIRRCFVNKDPDGKNNGYFGVEDMEGVTQYGYLLTLDYTPLTEEAKFVLRKKYVDLNAPFDCSIYSNWTFDEFESATGLPKEIEQCLFENFA